MPSIVSQTGQALKEIVPFQAAWVSAHLPIKAWWSLAFVVNLRRRRDRNGDRAPPTIRHSK